MTLAVDIELPSQAGSIREGTHWRLRAHPVQFNRDRIPKASMCREVVERAQVLVRPFDPYPEVESDHDAMETGPTWSAAWEDWTYWRMHQSGQFIHILRTPESGNPDWEAEQRRRLGVPNALGLVEAYWSFETLVKFFRFCGRLGNIVCPGEDIKYEADLFGVRQHMLYSREFQWPPRRAGLFCKQPVARAVQGVVASGALLANPDEAAISAALALFEQFGWSEASSGLLRSYLDSELAH